MFGQSLLSAFGSAACTTDTDQLFTTDVQTTSVATYQLNNATTSIPSNTYPGTPSNITYAAGKFGNAASFTGVSNGSYISLGNSSIFSPATQGAITFSCWINTSSGNSGYIASKVNDATSATYEWAIEHLSNGTLTLVAYNAQASVVASSINNTATIDDGNWHNVVAVIVNGTSTTLYIDGVPATSTSWTGTAATSSAAVVFLGAVGNSDATPPVQPGAAQHYGGLMDQVRFYNSALPQAAVTALYNETTTTATYPYITTEVANPNSIAYYKMSNAADQLGNYNGTATNVNFNTEGKFGFAGGFNGSSSVITTSLDLDTLTNYTISMWINPSSLSKFLAGTINSAASNGIYFYLDSGGTVRFVERTTSSNTLTSTDTISINTWNHLVFVRDGSTNYIYVNNGTPVSTSNWNITNSVGFTLARGGDYTPANSAYYNGSIDQVRIYNSAVSAANVTALYNEIECPAVEVTNAFNTVLWTGDSISGRAIPVGFQPDMSWYKSRNNAYDHNLSDSLRGAQKQIRPNRNIAEVSATDQITAFTSTGLTLGNGGDANSSNKTYVAWNWKAGGTAVSNTDGTITSQVSANVDAGFSIVKWNMSLPLSGTQTIGHGISRPDMIIYKNLDNASQWQVYTQPTGNGGVMFLNLSNSFSAGANKFPSVGSTTFTIGQDFLQYPAVYGGDNIAYCFTSIPGYSRVGSYSGNAASGSGTTQAIVTGFRPSWIMVKNTTSGSSQWVITDSTRGLTKELYPDLSNAENTDSSGIQSFNSNGFTVGNGYNFNRSSNDYIFMAIA